MERSIHMIQLSTLHAVANNLCPHLKALPTCLVKHCNGHGTVREQRKHDPPCSVETTHEGLHLCCFIQGDHFKKVTITNLQAIHLTKKVKTGTLP